MKPPPPVDPAHARTLVAEFTVHSQEEQDAIVGLLAAHPAQPLILFCDAIETETA